MLIQWDNACEIPQNRDSHKECTIEVLLVNVAQEECCMGLGVGGGGGQKWTGPSLFRDLKIGGITGLFKSESQCPAGYMRDSSPGGGTRVKASNVLASHPQARASTPQVSWDLAA